MILQNKREAYRFEILPTRRGEFKGTVTLRPGEWPIKNIDSDGEEVDYGNEDVVQNYTLWFTFDLKVHPPAPQSVVDLEANSMDTATLCIPLSNPFMRPIDLIVAKQGPYLSGLDTIQIPPKDKQNYELQFHPKQVGKFRGSLIFLNEEFGEFWYDLKLSSNDANTIQLEPVECEIGKYASVVINLANPLDEAIKFKTNISNPNYFGLEDKKHEQFHLEANSSIDVSIVFIPGAVGFSDHSTIVTFLNEKLGNIRYDLKGVGLEPECQDPINITSEIGQGQIVNVSFRNTTESAVFCDINLVDQENNLIDTENPTSQTLNILLETVKRVHMSPKSILDIPVLFNPTEMKRYNIKLVVTARREGDKSWQEPEKSDNKVNELKWVYPIQAVAVINPISKSAPFLLECAVRKRLEKRLEVTLTGMRSDSVSDLKSVLKIRSATPNTSKSNTPDKFESGGDYTHSIQYVGNLDQIDVVQNSVAMKLVRSQRDKQSGLLTLVFDFIFWPSKSFM